MQISGRYSQHARRAMMQARLCAQHEQHNMVDTSHLLVGILRAEGCIGFRVLQDLGLNRRQVESSIRPLHRLRPAHMESNSLPMSRALRSTLTFAVEESQALGHHYIGTEHLLLGLARGGGGAAQTMLHGASISLDQIRRQVRRVIQEGATEIGLERAIRMARLSELSRRVLNRAALIADDMQQPNVDLAHLILALAQESRSPSGQVLIDCGLKPNQLMAEATWPHAATYALLEDILDEAVLYAERMGSHYTGTDHIVLVLAQNRHSARLLTRYGVDLRQLTREMHRIMRRD
jgi:ATP-dependent Clp protease ATP-binding subunit ClpA